jgi:hypothetical protein
MALGVNGSYGESSIRFAVMDFQKVSVGGIVQSRAEEIEMSIFVEICQVAVHSNEQVVVCFGEGPISHTQHHHWIIYKDNVRISVSVDISDCCTFYPKWVREIKLGSDNILELT